MLRKRVSLKSLFSWISNFTFGNVRIALRHFFLAIHLPSYTLFSYLLFLRLPLAGSWVLWNLVLEFPFPRHPFPPPLPPLSHIYTIYWTLHPTSTVFCIIPACSSPLCPAPSSFISLNIPNFFPLLFLLRNPCSSLSCRLYSPSLSLFSSFSSFSSRFLIIRPFPLVKTTTSGNWIISGDNY